MFDDDSMGKIRANSVFKWAAKLHGKHISLSPTKPHYDQPSLTFTHPCLCLCVFFFSTLISRLARAMTSDTLDSVTLVNDI